MKILIVLLTLTLSNFAYATELLQSYDCKNSNDAMQCNSSCLKADQKLEFKVNERTNQVIRYSYADNKFIQAVPFENCTVVDGRNWICPNSNEIYYGEAIMRNGQYAHVGILTDKYKNSKVVSNRFFCAK